MKIAPFFEAKFPKEIVIEKLFKISTTEEIKAIAIEIIALLLSDGEYDAKEKTL